MKPILNLLIIFFLGMNIPYGLGQNKVGDLLTNWSKGEMDIHFINTGHGESTFLILPDSTTMLIDAGAALNKKPWAADSKPDDSKTPGEWIVRYINKMLSGWPNPAIDYAVISHFHWDHFGGVSSETKWNSDKTFQLSGITEVADLIQIKHVVDRSWPDYSPELNNDNMNNYLSFVRERQKDAKINFEKIKVGSNTQIKLVRNPDQFKNFEIRNIAANGKVWTGVGENSRLFFNPKGELLVKGEKAYDGTVENKYSIALRISYGKFDFFTGGDINNRYSDLNIADPYWRDIERPISEVVGPVEVMKANHHGNYDANSIQFLSNLNPQCIVICTTGASQPAMNVYRRMTSPLTYSRIPDIFVTNIMRETEIAYNLDKLKSKQGHVVVRIAPGGDTYKVYILDDSDESFRIKGEFGPYVSR